MSRLIEKPPSPSDKRDMDLSSVALSGIAQAQLRLGQAATRVSAVAGTSMDGAPVDTVDLSAAMVSILGARNDVEANINVLKIANDMQCEVMNLLA